MKEKIVEYNGRKVKAIDCTPTWSGIVRIYIEIIKHGETVEAKAAAEAEIIRMASLADKYNESLKDNKK